MRDTVIERQNEQKTPDRVGLYIKPGTRYRLNLFKAAMELETGKTWSQDDAISWLLEQHNTSDSPA